MSQLVLARPALATCVYARHPFALPSGRDARAVVLPATVAELAGAEIRAHPGVPITACLNGRWLLRADWSRALGAGDVLVLRHEVQGGGGDSLRTVLQIAALIAINALIPGSGIGATLGRVAAALAVNAILNNLIPPAASASGGLGASPSPTYNFALQGNQAALDEPIEVGYGYQRFYPRYAAQPYAEYADNDQFFYALLTVGQGRYAVHALELDDTALTHFADVTTNIVTPGGALTLVAANVATAVEVSGQELTCTAAEGGRYVGGIAACGGKRTCVAIGVDFVLNGLGAAGGDGSFGNKSVTVRIEQRQIDDYGAPVGSWSALATETITAATSSQVRRSFKYAIAAPVRLEIRCVRTDVKDDNAQVLNTLTWAGLRAYLAEAAPLAATATYLEVKIRASEQLNGLSQRKIAVYATRMLETWDPVTGWAGAGNEVETRNWAWAAADILRSATYGKGLADGRIDMATLHTLAQTADDRQDRFDLRFDQSITAEQALQTAAKTARAVPVLRGGIWTFMRDELQTLPAALYTPRTMHRGSFQITDRLPTSTTPDGVDLRYFDNRAWDWLTIRCPVPGKTAAEVTNAQQVTIEGIGGAKHAEREGLYIAADSYYRRRLIDWENTADAQLAAYGALVLVAHDLPQEWGQSGEVVDWDAGALTLTLTEPVRWGTGTSYVRLHRTDGSVHPAIMVTPGAADNEAVLASAPDFTPVTADAGSERTRYVIGSASDAARGCRVKKIEPRNSGRFALQVVLEDERVHSVDNHLLPSPGEVQDPIATDADYTNIDTGGGTVNVVTLLDHNVSAGDSSGATGEVAKFTLGSDGRASGYSQELSHPSATTYYSGQWLNSTVGPSTAALWEVRFSEPGGANPWLGGDALDTWLSLGTDRAVYLDSSIGTPPTTNQLAHAVRVEIREAATGIVQCTRTVYLSLIVELVSP